jgi:hypothetical protein
LKSKTLFIIQKHECYAHLKNNIKYTLIFHSRAFKIIGTFGLQICKPSGNPGLVQFPNGNVQKLGAFPTVNHPSLSTKRCLCLEDLMAPLVLRFDVDFHNVDRHNVDFYIVELT